MESSHNDINMLQRSQVFYRLAEDNAQVLHYEFNSHEYNMFYYLADDIYP
jgi:hypothetical protein